MITSFHLGKSKLSICQVVSSHQFKMALFVCCIMRVGSGFRALLTGFGDCASATFHEVVTAFNKLMPIRAMSHSEVYRAMLLMGPWLQMVRIRASAIATFVMQLLPIWDWPNKDQERHHVRVKARRGFHMSLPVAFELADRPNPVPAARGFIKAHAQGKIINIRIGSREFHGSKNPTRLPKVEPARMWRQSGTELVKRISILFSGCSKAISSLALAGAAVNEF